MHSNEKPRCESTRRLGASTKSIDAASERPLTGSALASNVETQCLRHTHQSAALPKLHSATASDQLHDDHNDGNDEQNMDKTASEMKADKSQQPHQYKNTSNGPKHQVFLSVV